MSHDKPINMEGCSAEDISEIDKRKFDILFGNVPTKTGTFGLTRVILNGVPCTAVLFINGKTSAELDEAAAADTGVIDVVAQLEFIFVNPEILSMVQNHLGLNVTHAVYTH